MVSPMGRSNGIRNTKIAKRLKKRQTKMRREANKARKAAAAKK